MGFFTSHWVLTFLIVCFAIFLVVKAYNRVRAPVILPEAPVGKQCPFCLETVNIKATRCNHCTSDLTGVPLTAPV